MSHTSSAVAPYIWNSDVDLVERLVATWPNHEAMALTIWAMRDVESLHYLAEHDAAVVSADAARDDPHRATSESAYGFSPVVIDNAHAKWAAVTAVSAVDRCAGALGRLHGQPKPPGKEYDVEDFKALSKRKNLTTAGKHWIETVRRDDRYPKLKGFRNPSVHGQLPRVVTATMPRSRVAQRDRLKVPTPAGVEDIPIRTIIESSRDFATEHVEAFLKLIETKVIS